MNRFERRKAESIKRKVRAMKPAARELAIQTGMELHDAFAEERAEKRKQEIRSIFESEWASKRDELYKQASEEQANRFAERVYGALRWLATTYHGAKTGVSCPDLVASCRRASGFRYTAHQSEVTMGQYASDYEVTWGGKGVKLREHVGFGTSRDPRHTIRVAFFFDDKTKRVVVGYVGLHQQTRAT